MSDTDDNPHPIEVRRTGAHLGWNVLAALGAFLLGLYVNSVVKPLETNIASNASSLAHNKSAILVISTEFRAHEDTQRVRIQRITDRILVLEVARRYPNTKAGGTDADNP